MATHDPTATHDHQRPHAELKPPMPIWSPPTQSQSWEERGFTVSRERKRVESVRERDEKKKKKKKREVRGVWSERKREG